MLLLLLFLFLLLLLRSCCCCYSRNGGWNLITGVLCPSKQVNFHIRWWDDNNDRTINASDCKKLFQPTIYPFIHLSIYPFSHSSIYPLFHCSIVPSNIGHRTCIARSLLYNDYNKNITMSVHWPHHQHIQCANDSINGNE